MFGKQPRHVVWVFNTQLLPQLLLLFAGLFSGKVDVPGLVD